MDIPADVLDLVESVFASHDGGDTVGYMAAAIMADREKRDPHEETEHFLRVAIDRSPEQLRQLGEYLADTLDEDQFPRADRLMLGMAEEHKRRDDALRTVTAALVAAASILSRADSAKVRPSSAVGSKKMFEQMLRDYGRAIEAGRDAIR